MQINSTNYNFTSYIKSASPRNKRKNLANAAYKEAQDLFSKMTKENSEVAFLYNPDLFICEKKEQAEKIENIFNLNDYEAKSGISAHMLAAWGNAGHFDVMKLGHTYDVQFISSDSEFLDKANEKLEDCIKVGDLMKDCNITTSVVRKMLKNDEIKILYLDEVGLKDKISEFLIDVTDETNAKTIAYYKKLSPKASEKYYKFYERKRDMVPVRYLSELDFGSPQKLRELVKTGYLPGTIKEIETEDGIKTATYVDIADEIGNAEGKLIALRKANRSVISFDMLSKILALPINKLKQAIIDDEILIIPEYIFSQDFSKIFIDLKNPVNKEFVQKHNTKKD